MTENFELNKLIGIPFRLNQCSFKGCDCRGIVCLYYNNVLNKFFPFSDGKRVFFRDKSKDLERITSALDLLGEKVGFDNLQKGDVVVLKTTDNIGALGVCINDKQVLHMDLKIGSCLTKLRYLKDIFYTGYRMYD